MQVWVDYDGVQKKINVTLAPMNVGKPKIPLLSLSRDLSPIINDEVYVGFSASTGSVLSNHYVLGWSFKINGQAPELFQSQLPDLPRKEEIPRKEKLRSYTIALPVIIVSLVSVTIAGVVYVVKRKRNFAELLEDWELDYAPQRFKYKDLYIATKGFKDKELLGTGGFGKVYRGVLPTSEIEIAVKKVSHESRQGIREFISEIVSTGRLRHRNLVPLMGYCRRKEELLLVYEYMPNGSLDKYLFGQLQATLSWSQRFRVLKGVASGLLYLHEEWEKVVVHRDVKASNVLLDRELNGRLGDFGLARLYDHGTDAQTTHVAGTIGYLAPENFRGGKPTTSTDVFAFGAFLLEVACGRKPIQPGGPTEDVLLVDWVFSHWKRGQILEARDPKLRTEYEAEELELVLKLGLLCSHSAPTARPSMRQIVQYLDGDVPLPEISASGLTFAHRDGSNVFAMTSPASVGNAFEQSSFVADSVLSAGR
ncbi:L-type lectin-domain containing receptor kinase IV.2 [Morella rubra]|uniref:non-specific serine/threonine protein kinase n=1 Tax=Morella rubra TaxID=262757 RepID=A0A6A1W6E3_9ROSI|nr:L-type lectin-domain containing receptor kinase IV.2 [Morella rubra]